MPEQTPLLQGVNLGGWLVLEKWMTPSLFGGTGAVDEYTFMQKPGAEEKIDTHRRTFITEDDFVWLAHNNINAVRIPIGYWIFDGDEPYTNGITYLDWAIKTAKKYDIHVVIDLHGAKGSQNGRDHSGRIGSSKWFNHAEYRQQTIETLEKIAKRYYGDDNVWGIELLNEPKFGLFHFKLRRFYQQAYDRLVKVARPGTHIIFHDAFTPRLMSGAIKARPSHPVIMDIHWYQFTTLFHQLYNLQHYFKKVQSRSHLLRRVQKKQPAIVGEWSVVLSARILAGRAKKQERSAFKRHARVQLKTYAQTAGWFYWTYKTEGQGIWHFRSLVEDGTITVK